jgi:hypothetical protein
MLARDSVQIDHRPFPPETAPENTTPQSGGHRPATAGGETGYS